MASSIMVAVRVRPDSKAEQHQDGGADFLRVADDRTVSPTRAKYPYFEISSVALSVSHLDAIPRSLPPLLGYYMWWGLAA
jgi:hypothetical protein